MGSGYESGRGERDSSDLGQRYQKGVPVLSILLKRLGKEPEDAE